MVKCTALTKRPSRKAPANLVNDQPWSTVGRFQRDAICIRPFAYSNDSNDSKDSNNEIRELGG